MPSSHIWAIWMSSNPHFNNQMLTLSGAEGGFTGYLYGATSTLFVGGIAAAAAFGLVKVLDPNGA